MQTIVRTSLILCSTLLAACVDEGSGTGPTPARPAVTPRVASTRQDPRPRTLDEDYVEIATKVPGFGGLFLTEEGTVVNVFLKQETSRAEIEPLVAAFLTSHGSKEAGANMASGMRVHAGDYDFRELSENYGEILRTVSMEGITLTDIDETRNRIVLGAIDERAVTRLRSILRSTRIPVNAVQIEVRPLMRTEWNLQQFYRPFMSGLQIVTDGGPGECTAGYLTWPYANGGIIGDGTLYFLTNSHCTSTFGVNDGLWAGQPTMATPIAFEAADPALEPPGSYYLCPTFLPNIGAVTGCRGSDAALFAVTGAVGSFQHGVVAKSLVTNNVNFWDTFNLQYDWSFDYPVGTPVRKTGRSTGTTAGTITNYCVGLPQGTPFGTFTGRFMTCQIQASYYSLGGDSGSSVFVPHPGNVATVQGLHWGRDAALGKSAYSPWGSINYEIKQVMGWDMTARYYY